MEKIGLFGGTFNPPHLGHLHIACAFADELQLDSVIFLPAGEPYHKAGSLHIAAEHRWQMVQLACETDVRFAASDVDLVREGATYTIDTISIFRQYLPNAQFWWLMGMDSLYALHTWKKWQALVRQVNIAVAARAGQSIVNVPAPLHDYVGDALGAGSLHLLQAAPLDISSREIRTILAQGGDASAFLPHSVAEYIRMQNLYRT